MATSAYNKFNDFSEQLIRGVHDWDAHTFKIALTNTAPSAANAVLADISQISAGGGYTSGGTATTISVSETSGTTTVSGTEVVFTGTGSGFGPFRYAVLYNDSAASKNLVSWFDYGSSISVGAGENFTVRFNNATPGAIFTLA
jgi:hypothetical protein